MVSRPLARPDRRPSRSATPAPSLPSLLPLVLVVVLLLSVGCSGEEAVPIDPANPPTTGVDLTDVTHRIEPTDEMREAAAQQCLDDPTLAEGYVRAVEPETDRTLTEVTVDCDEARAGR